MAAHPEYMNEMFSQITLDRTGVLAKELPRLVWKKSGEQTSEETIAALLKTLKVTGPVMESGSRRTRNRTVFAGQRDRLRADLRQLNDDVERESALEFGRALWALWEKKRYHTDLAWLAWGAGFFGDDTMTLSMYKQMQKAMRQGKDGYRIATQMLNVLMSIDTPMARMTLASYARSARANTLQQKAMACVEAAAKREGVSLERLEDISVPSCGLDDRGRRTFSYGPRSFEVTVGENFYPVVRDEKGKITKNLPRSRKSDDAVSVEEARAQWDMLKGSLIHTFKIQLGRLEQMMVARRRWRAEEWREQMCHHPVMTLFARNLLWRAHEASGEMTLFRVAEDMTLAGVDDEAWELAEDVEVSLVHPIDMTTDELQRWGDVFMDYELIAPFEQLGRQVYVQGDESLDLECVIKGEVLDPRKLRIFMKYNDFDSSWATTLRTGYFKRLMPYNTILRFDFSPGLQVGGYDQDVEQRITAVGFEVERGKGMDAMAFSEGWRTLQRLLASART